MGSPVAIKVCQEKKEEKLVLFGAVDQFFKSAC